MTDFTKPPKSLRTDRGLIQQALLIRDRSKSLLVQPRGD